MILIFNDLSKAPLYEMPYRDSPDHEIEIFMSFIYLKLLKPNERKEDYKPSDENFPFEVEDKKYVYVGEKLVNFETNEERLNFSSHLGFNDIKHPFAYSGENIYFFLHQNYVPI